MNGSLALGLVALLGTGLLGVWFVGRCEKANGADWGGPWLNRLDGMVRLFCRRYHRFQSDPIPVPERGGALLASNHVSGLDPILMIVACPRPLRFMIAKEQYNRWWIRWLYRRLGSIPVDRQGAPEKAFYAARKALDEGQLIGVFPEGRVVRPNEPPVALKRGVIALAHLADVPIIPLRVGGIAGAGKIVRAVFVRSHARLEAGEPIRVAGARDDDALVELAGFIQASGPARQIASDRSGAGSAEVS